MDGNSEVPDTWEELCTSEQQDKGTDPSSSHPTTGNRDGDVFPKTSFTQSSCFPPSPPTARLSRLRGRVKPASVSFEFKMAGLLALRSRRRDLHYASNTNVAAAKPLDDVVFRVKERNGRSATVFMQLHHASKDLRLEDFTSEKNKFYLNEYFKFFRKYKEIYNQQKYSSQNSVDFIYDCNWDDLYFIFYTPRKRSDELPEPIKQWKSDTFFSTVVNILETGEESEIFKFTEKDTEVWHLFGENFDLEEEYHEFLSKLLVFSSQANSTYLYTLIKMEMDLLFHDPLPYALTAKFIKFLEDWGSDEEWDFCLAHDSYVVDWVMATHTQETAKEAVKDISFQEDKDLRHCLENNSRIVLTVPNVSRRHRIAKLLGILESLYEDNWVYIDKTVHSQYSEEFVKCLCKWCYCKLFVLNFDDINNLQWVLQFLEKAPNVVILNSEDSKGAVFDTNALQGGWKKFTNIWLLDQLAEPVKTKLMECKLQFQGRAMALGDVVAAWSWLRCGDVAGLLSAVLRGRATLGRRLTEPNLSIPRQLLRAGDHGSVRELSAEELRAPVALLAAEAGAGKSSVLHKMAADSQEEAPLVWTVLVPVLHHLELLRRLPPPEEMTVENALELVAEAGVAAVAAAATVVERRCLVEAAMEAGCVRLFVDGVDEVCPVHQPKITRVLQLLLKQTKIDRLWVSTRPELEGALTRELGCLPVTLRPLAREEQKTFLCVYWGAVHEEDVLKFQDFADSLLDALSSSYENSLLGAPLPLQAAAEFFAQAALRPCVSPSLLRFCRRLVARSRALCMQRHGLRDCNFDNTPLSEDDDFHGRHQSCAMYSLLSGRSRLKEHINLDPFVEYLKRKKDALKKEKFGILWVDDHDVPRFSHPIFVDYFAAEWLSANCEEAVKYVLDAVEQEANERSIGSFVRVIWQSIEEEKERKQNLFCRQPNSQTLI